MNYKHDGVEEIIENFDIANALEIFKVWSETIINNVDEVTELINTNPEADAMYSFIHHAAIEIKYFETQYVHMVFRFLNTIKTLSIICNAMSEKYGEKFTNVVAPPPICIAPVNLDKNELH